MAEEDEDIREPAEGEGEGEEGASSGGGLKKKLILVLVPLLLLGVGGGLYFTGVIGGGDKVEQHAEAEGEEGHGEEGHGEGGHGEEGTSDAAFYELPNLIVNLSSPQGTRFLKLKVQLELENSADLGAIEAVTPRVIDQFQTFLREMRVEDLRGSAGIYRLRQELLYRVNIAAHPVKVKDVLFQEMLIQ